LEIEKLKAFIESGAHKSKNVIPEHGKNAFFDVKLSE
jgi:hypothetical protein